MRLSAGVITFLVGLVVLAIAGVFYSQFLVATGQYGHGGTNGNGQAAQANVKYACPMRCAEFDEPGMCPVCGMDMMPIEMAVAAPQEPAYYCPHHPHVTKDSPGTCVACGMELVPYVGDDAGVDPAVAESVSAVKLSPLQAVLANVQPISPVLEDVTVLINAIGEVSVSEDRVNSIVSWQAGRVDNLLLRETGGYINSGAHILDIYSEELVQAQDEYLLALEAVSSLGDSGYESITSSSQRLLDATRRKLERLGLSTEQIDGLDNGGAVREHTEITATHGGVVMEKFVTEGMYVREGERLFTVADLSRVWVEVEVFEHDFSQLAVGQAVTMHCPVHQGMVFTGKIELIEPSLNPRTRTHITRVEVSNTDGILRPGMVMDTELTVNFGEKLLLTRNAVLHTGDGDLVYVLSGENQWQPREVVIGQDFGDSVEIVSGLSEGDLVAGTAVFLLDSEAQLKGIPRLTNGDTSMDDHEPAGDPHAGHNH